METWRQTGGSHREYGGNGVGMRRKGRSALYSVGLELTELADGCGCTDGQGKADQGAVLKC